MSRYLKVIKLFRVLEPGKVFGKPYHYTADNPFTYEEGKKYLFAIGIDKEIYIHKHMVDGGKGEYTWTEEELAEWTCYLEPSFPQCKFHKKKLVHYTSFYRDYWTILSASKGSPIEHSILTSTTQVFFDGTMSKENTLELNERVRKDLENLPGSDQ